MSPIQEVEQILIGYIPLFTIRAESPNPRVPAWLTRLRVGLVFSSAPPRPPEIGKLFRDSSKLDSATLISRTAADFGVKHGVINMKWRCPTKNNTISQEKAL